MGLIPVESRHCAYLTSSGTTRTFFCSSYEYCCGNACCRPAVITFYQLWYFWLSVIMILLLCSGGSWWYRFKYRNQFLSPPGHFLATAGPNLEPRHHTIGAFYFPGNDRVYLHNPPKDPNLYPYMGGVIAPPPYTTTDTGALLMGTQSMSQQPPPPPFTAGPPPSYDTIIQMPNHNQGATMQPTHVAMPEEEHGHQNAILDNNRMQLPYPISSPSNSTLRNRNEQS